MAIGFCENRVEERIRSMVVTHFLVEAAIGANLGAEGNVNVKVPDHSAGVLGRIDKIHRR